ncbi:MAG: hypothetical protein D6824_01755 [Planctomycetota bacterium]|nr:MAG: hypothetical protein D6824_01755 [Planctomycetota bacterium]
MATLKELDRKIQEALRRQDDLDEALASPEDEGLVEMLIGVFRGRMVWLNIYGMTLGVAFTGLAVWCAVRFFQSADVKAALGWGVGFLTCVLFVAMLKIWFWMEIEKNTVLREVKRLELQVARLAAARR